MKEISNMDIDAEKCTKCSTCGKSSWYIQKCDCGHIVCEYCSAEKSNDEDKVIVRCPKCNSVVMYVD